MKYQSVFSDYRPYEEQQLAPWKQVHEEVAGVPGAAGHAGHGATASPMAPQGPARMSGAHEGHAGMMMAKPPETSAPVAEPMAAPTGAIIGTGVILQVDKANAKVKMTHDPIAALGWPKMTMFFRLKDRSLADQVKEGEAVQFLLEKSGAGYVISDFGKPGSGPVEKK
ncbi:MAG: copper-binding protein [Pseudomonadota bacterium]